MPALQLLHSLPPGAPEATAASRQHVHETVRRLIEDVRQLVRQGQAQGVLADEDPMLMAVALVGMCTGFARRASYGVETDLEAATRVIHRAFLRGFSRAAP
jgi:triphosphoribosyl-dephospho-CoA synthetase